MSEYQYYEFAAIDRPLTREQMSRLRALSTRATITPMRFCNFYTWGDFKGDPLALIEEYFDAFVYVTNWGTHELMLRLPRRLLAAQWRIRTAWLRASARSIRRPHDYHVPLGRRGCSGYW